MKDGQELKGLIGASVPQAPEGIEFKQDENSEVVVYFANDVAGYDKDGTFYTSYVDPGDGPSRWVFIEIIVQGEVSLFLRNKMFFVLERGKKNVFVHLDSKYKSKLRKISGGCPFLSAKAWRLKADKAILGQFVKDYNTCVGVSNPNYEGMPRKVSVALLAGSDVSASRYNDDGNAHTRFMTSTKLRDQSALQLGFDITLRDFKISNVMGLYTGIYYSPTAYKELTGVKHQSFEVNEFTINYTQLKIPLGFEIGKPSKERFSFHMRFGIVYSKVMNLKSTHPIWEVHDASGNVYTQEPARIGDIELPILVSAAAGVDYRAFGNSRIRLQAGFTFGGTNAAVYEETKATSLSGTFTSMQLMAGFVF